MQAGAFFPKGAVMTNQEIFELMARFDASTATTLKLSTKDFSLEDRKSTRLNSSHFH